MTKSLGTLGDLFPDNHVQCKVRGCINTWSMSGERAMRSVATGRDPQPERMCDECFQIFNSLEDRELPCSNAGCTGTWIWRRYSQLEAVRQGRGDQPPRGLCDACRQRVQAMQDVEVPCRMRSCDRTWTWYRRDQLKSPDGKPPSRLCDECFRTLNRLQDQEVPCRVRSCTHTWTWSRYQQLEYERAGHDPSHPPKRMCEECFRLFHDLRDQEIACSTEGCGRTWKFTTYAQLEHLLTNGADAPVPTRLCGKCFGFMQHAHDRQMPCLNRGCPNTWSYTREMQLQDRIHDRVPEPRRCAMCEQRIAETQDREIPCSVAGCTNAWNYSAEEQVRDACNGRTTPPEKRCRACEEFLASHEAQSVPCPHCGRQIAWSAYEQLLCERGTFVRPSMCVDCAEQQMAIREPVETEQQHAHHHVVRMPSSGRWHADPATTDWPPHLTHDIIAEVELADVRIVALGDDLTYSSEDRDSSWPKLLQEALTRLLDGRSVSVVNAGMPGTTTAQAVVRFARDVQPFAPHLTLVSFCFRDSFIRPGTEGEAQTGRAEEAVAAMHKLCGLLRRRTPGKAMYWVPNPSYPHDADVRGFSASWANAQEAARRQLMVQEGHVCQEYGIPVLDLRSRFEVNGKKSALKWMCDWFRHNETGARNIATWMAQYIVRENLLDA